MNDSSPPDFAGYSSTPSAKLSDLELGWQAWSASEAEAALTDVTDQGISPIEALTDLVTFMRHLADQNGIRWPDVAGWAECHFYRETRGELLTDPGPLDHIPDRDGLAEGRVRVLPDLVPYHGPEVMVRRTNQVWADKAAAALRRFYSGECQRYGNYEEGLIDLLTALRHLADRPPSVDWAEIEYQAECHYHAEIRGEP